jgi:hypothetical protein
MVSLEFDSNVRALHLRLCTGSVVSTQVLADNMAVDIGEDGTFWAWNCFFRMSSKKRSRPR